MTNCIHRCATGHSRLVVGVEEHGGKDGGLYLLLFDPSHSAKQMHALSDDIQSNSSALRHLRRSLKQMRCKQYQIVCAEGVMAPAEVQHSKILGSLRIPWQSKLQKTPGLANTTARLTYSRGHLARWL